jgi:hypothetical protein
MLEDAMSRDDIIRMGREAGMEHREHADEVNSEYCDGVHLDDLERFAALVRADERNKVAQWMMAQGYATGHGDTTKDLLKELEWQVRESERNACAAIARQWDVDHQGSNYGGCIAKLIEARGQDAA